jgi:type III restriction enzyme
VVGLRPFMSQLLCEQVVGRALRRRAYAVDEHGKFTEEVAKVFGVPFEVIPFKTNPAGARPHVTPPKRVHALPHRAHLEIRFPRVDGYLPAIDNRVTVDWEGVPPLYLNPEHIPAEVQMKAGLLNNQGRPSLMGPGKLETVDLNPYRQGRREQELAFELARDLTRAYLGVKGCNVPPHALFPQLAQITLRYLKEKVQPFPPMVRVDAFLSPYYGWIIEALRDAIRGDAEGGEAPEKPQYEKSREAGSTADVDFYTHRDVREVLRSHVNYVVADTHRWEQSAAYIIDTHPAVEAFVKNAGLGFAIRYYDNGNEHDYIPDFLIRFAGRPDETLILETKGWDPTAEIKRQAAERWVAAVNADGSYGRWSYEIARSVPAVRAILDAAVAVA